MSEHLIRKKANFGTGPVFLTAISTILGAILFLRFGYAVAHTGFMGTIAIIVIGHLITIPTAMAVAEIATNIKVEGGGAYYIISRSFGLNIGAAIGIALYLSQAISVAFYVIAFAESFEPFAIFLTEKYPQYTEFIGPYLTDKRVVGLFSMSLLTILMLTKGANIGMKALYWVVAILFISLASFFMGGTDFPMSEVNLFDKIDHPDSFFLVFTIIFPAFTGIAAGLGLSGDLKDPKRSIPRGTLWATAAGILVYVAVAFKLVISAPLEDLANDQLIMSKIAIWGPLIPIGLAGAAISSALGSVMVAPRTLQALGIDKIFPVNPLNKWFAKGKSKDNEPINASIITCVVAFIFVGAGDINSVAKIISMFFMVTYGAICLISFLEHFSADPSYRPTFRSKWYISLLGAILSIWLMFKMNLPYALFSLAIMVGIYIYISKYNTDKAGLARLFKGVIFQLSRQLQVYVQKRDYNNPDQYWRPFTVCVTKHSFERRDAFDLMRWLSQRYGFGTYIHYIEGYLSKQTHKETKRVMKKLLKMGEGSKSKVYMDTIVSPSYTSALAQTMQLSGISGKGHNLILFEYSRDNPEALEEVVNNYAMFQATGFDVCILGSSYRHFGYKKEIHIWVSSKDYENSNLMILLSYILLGHREWNEGIIKMFSVYPEGKEENQKERLLRLIKEGRLPISPSNIDLIAQGENESVKSIINKHSSDADLTVIGFQSELVKKKNTEIFEGYDELGNMLFVNSINEKEIS